MQRISLVLFLFFICLTLVTAQVLEFQRTTAVRNGLIRHNFYREKHQVPNFIYDQDIANFSQSFAEELGERGLLVNSGNKKSGENLYKACSTEHIAIEEAIEKATDEWYKGFMHYDFNNPDFSIDSGSFTQLVWKSSNKIGFGLDIKIENDLVCVYIVAMYFPAGNVAGKFKENVINFL